MDDEIRACFRDMHVFNSTVIGALILRLEKKGILTAHEASTWFVSAADQLEAMEADQNVSAMLRDLAESLVDAETRPRWTPRVIEGGKLEPTAVAQPPPPSATE